MTKPRSRIQRKPGTSRRPPRAQNMRKEVTLPRAANSLIQRTRVPIAQAFTNTERVLNVPGSVAFAVLPALHLNPSLEETFPWLASIARMYDRYSVEKCTVKYVSTRGSSTDGTVSLVYDPDTLDAAPGSITEASQSASYVSGAPWRSFDMKLPLTTQRKYFTRTSGTVGIGADLKTYDFGQLFIATEGMSDTSQVGFIELEYVFRLYEPQAMPAELQEPPNVFQAVLTNDIATADTASAYVHIAGTAFTTKMDTIGVTANGSGWVLPVGYYRFTGSVTWPCVTRAYTAGYSAGTAELSAQHSTLNPEYRAVVEFNHDNTNTGDVLYEHGTASVIVPSDGVTAFAIAYFQIDNLLGDSSTVIMSETSATTGRPSTFVTIERLTF